MDASERERMKTSLSLIALLHYPLQFVVLLGLVGWALKALGFIE
jgi:hypothetical protein